MEFNEKSQQKQIETPEEQAAEREGLRKVTLLHKGKAVFKSDAHGTQREALEAASEKFFDGCVWNISDVIEQPVARRRPKKTNAKPRR